jgi:serine/threonine-protein kinase
MLRILEGSAPAPSASRPDVPASLDAVTSKALATRPDARFATAREMADAIEAAIVPARRRDVSAWMRELAAADLATRSRQEEDAQSRATTFEAAPPRLGRAWTRRGIVALGALALVAGGVGLTARRRATPVTEAASTAPPVPASASPPVVPADPPVAPEAPLASAVASAHGRGDGPPRTPSARPRPKPARSPAPACSPPYTVRADGVHVPKPECF